MVDIVVNKNVNMKEKMKKTLEEIRTMLKWLIISKLNQSNPQHLVGDQNFQDMLIELPDISDIIMKLKLPKLEVEKRGKND